MKNSIKTYTNSNNGTKNFLQKSLEQINHITDIKHNIDGKSFITKYIPTVNILNSKLQIKDK